MNENNTTKDLLSRLWSKLSNHQNLLAKDAEYQNYIDHVKLTKESDIDTAIEKFIEWFYQDELIYCNKLIRKLESQFTNKAYITQKLAEVPEVNELITDLKNS